jgi:hypothetical protein
MTPKQALQWIATLLFWLIVMATLRFLWGWAAALGFAAGFLTASLMVFWEAGGKALASQGE